MGPWAFEELSGLWVWGGCNRWTSEITLVTQELDPDYKTLEEGTELRSWIQVEIMVTYGRWDQLWIYWTLD